MTFTRLQARKRIPKLSLFRLRDLYLVVDSYGDDQSEDRDPMWYDYLFHSHQCPTNMLKNVVELFDNSERDPHGVLRFVSAIDDTEENRKRLDESPTKEELFRLFQTDGQDAHSHWPEENKGVIPWIAAMRRGAGIPVSSFSVKITSSEEDIKQEIKQEILKADITQNLDKSEMEKQVIEYMTKALEGIIGKEKW